MFIEINNIRKENKPKSFVVADVAHEFSFKSPLLFGMP